ncbi:MAG: phosphoribosyltransferase domain-containing protein [Kineosporiaceae bacterium]|nr:phosphoribosyltransferase domain-containing protein [Kineosporiaceae bacterium]
MIEGLGAVGWTVSRVDIGVRMRRAHPTLPDIGLGLRENPRRVQLIVTPPLAKHVPVPPARALSAAASLASAVRDDSCVPIDLVVGFAETATGLAILVAQSLAGSDPMDIIHSTRVPVSRHPHPAAPCRSPKTIRMPRTMSCNQPRQGS